MVYYGLLYTINTQAENTDTHAHHAFNTFFFSNTKDVHLKLTPVLDHWNITWQTVPAGTSSYSSITTFSLLPSFLPLTFDLLTLSSFAGLGTLEFLWVNVALKVLKRLKNPNEDLFFGFSSGLSCGEIRYRWTRLRKKDTQQKFIREDNSEQCTKVSYTMSLMKISYLICEGLF